MEEEPDRSLYMLAGLPVRPSGSVSEERSRKRSRNGVVSSSPRFEANNHRPLKSGNAEAREAEADTL